MGTICYQFNVCDYDYITAVYDKKPKVQGDLYGDSYSESEWSFSFDTFESSEVISSSVDSFNCLTNLSIKLFVPSICSCNWTTACCVSAHRQVGWLLSVWIKEMIESNKFRKAITRSYVKTFLLSFDLSVTI